MYNPIPENLHEIFLINNIDHDTFRLKVSPEYSRIQLEYEMRGIRRIGEERFNDMMNFIDNESGTYNESYTDSNNIKRCIIYMYQYISEDRRNIIISIACHLINETVYCEMTNNIV